MGAARRRLALQHLQPEHLGVEPDCPIHVAHPHPAMQQLLHLHRRTYLPIGLSDSREWPSCCQGAPTRGAESRACVLDLFNTRGATMDLGRLHRRSECEWEIAPTGKMRVPAVIYATEPLIRDMDDKVFEQVTNVAALPGIVQASYAMPDAHWGYGFPIGGVAAFDPDRGGVLSAGGVGFDISCGVRTLCTGLTVDDIPP